MKAISHLHHALIPRHSNNYKARLLQPAGITVVLLSLFLVQSVFQLVMSTSPSVLGYAAQIDINEVIRLTNLKREENGLAPVTLNLNLTDAAKQKGDDMLSHDYWAHISPTGVEPWDFFNSVGYKYRYAGENLARDFSSANGAVDAWMASPSHRENMLSSKYKEIGVAVVEGDLAGQDTTIIVQLFGTKAQDAVAVPVAAAQDNQEITQSETEPSTVPNNNLVLPTPNTDVVVSTSFSSSESPFNATRAVSLGTVGFMMVLLTGDMLYISRHNISRKSSRSFAHLAFLGMVFAILLVIKAGKII